MMRDDSLDQSQDEGRAQPDPVDWNHDPGGIRFVNLLIELGADSLFEK